MALHRQRAVADAPRFEDMHYDIITDHAAARPSNTVKQVAPKQAKVKTWCAGKKYLDGCIVTEGKLVTLLKTHVIPR
ncbi:hypothetical protein GN958_ATG06506, partial [Phytophthora infestans]